MRSASAAHRNVRRTTLTGKRTPILPLSRTILAPFRGRMQLFRDRSRAFRRL